MKRLHLVPEASEANGVFQVARMLAKRDGGELLIPALKAVVKDIDIPGGTMTVEMPEEITAGGKEAAGDSHAH